MPRKWRPFMKKYHVASEPQPVRREATLYKIAQDISRISDVQGILALIFAVTLAGAVIYAIVKATTTEAMTAVIQILVPIVSAIVGFYFGKRTAEAADFRQAVPCSLPDFQARGVAQVTSKDKGYPKVLKLIRWEFGCQIERGHERLEETELHKILDEAKRRYDASCDKIIDILNKLFAYARERKMPQSIFIRKRNGAPVETRELLTRMGAIDYKLRYAASSLEHLSREYKKREENIDPDRFPQPEPVPEEVVFHIDVFFSFVSSALDFSAWTLHLVLGTELPDIRIDFRSVVKDLSKREDVYLFKRLMDAIENGWLKSFFGYRHYVNHWSLMVPHSGWRWTAKDKTVEITIFMLPDDPRVFPTREVKYKKRIELVPYCEEALANTLNTISDIFDLLSQRLDATGRPRQYSSLTIPE